MKFPTENGIAKVGGDQRGAKECYSNSIWKVELRSVNVILMDIDEVNNSKQGTNPGQGEDVEIVDASEKKANMEIQLGLEEGRVAEEAAHFDELDPCIINDEP